jgi:hypothetical protein
MNILEGPRLILLDQSGRMLFVVRNGGHQRLFIIVELLDIVFWKCACMNFCCGSKCLGDCWCERISS